MSKLIWTKEKPTEEGHYWFTARIEWKPSVASVYRRITERDSLGKLKIRMNEQVYDLDKCGDCYWCYIPEPKEVTE